VGRAIDLTSGKAATGTEKPVLMVRLINQAISALWIPEGTSEERKNELIESAIALLQGIKPQDEIEGMLATQMVATHSAAMDCLRRAMLDGQTFEGRDKNLKHAAKLLTIYARQIETLDKHRGKGQQKVTVEHVHVAAGGHAVVGNIEAAAVPPISGEQSNDAPKAITHAPQESFEVNSRSPMAAERREK
jgi:hypothetical protein